MKGYAFQFSKCHCISTGNPSRGSRDFDEWENGGSRLEVRGALFCLDWLLVKFFC